MDHRALVDTIVTGQAIGFIGALIGGVAANRRKAKLEELAQKLKGVNSQLRQQARQAKEGQYAPEAAAEGRRRRSASFPHPERLRCVGA